MWKNGSGYFFGSFLVIFAGRRQEQEEKDALSLWHICPQYYYRTTMTFREKLDAARQRNASRLCVGLDTDIDKLPAHLRTADHPLTEFNCAVVEATRDLACAFKLNIAFYEQYGVDGWEALRKTLACIPDDVITIADAKRGDIGNTSAAYASAFFDYFDFDAITVNPYMGADSVQPFLSRPDKFVFLLALTSNSGSGDFQRLVCDGKPLYRQVIEKAMTWTEHDNLGFVVGATHPDELAELRTVIPDVPLLIPGIGTQGGDAEATMRANGAGPAVVNVSRAVIYASGGRDFAERAGEKADEYRAMIG